MTELQLLFSMAPSTVTTIKSAESITTELKVTIWLHCELTNFSVKDFNSVKRHSYVLRTLQKHLSTVTMTGWQLHQCYTANEAPNLFFFFLINVSSQIAWNVTYCNNTSRDIHGKYVYPCCYAHFWKLFSEQVYRSTQDLTCSFSSCDLACLFYK